MAAQPLNLVKGCAGDRHSQSLGENDQDICAAGWVDPSILFLQSRDWRGFLPILDLKVNTKFILPLKKA